MNVNDDFVWIIEGMSSFMEWIDGKGVKESKFPPKWADWFKKLLFHLNN